MAKLPKTLFVRIDKEGDDIYFYADVSLDDVVEGRGITKVGLYKLESVNGYQRVSELVKES